MKRPDDPGATVPDPARDPVLLARVRAALDDGLGHYDAATRSRLTRARHAALAQAPSSAWWTRWWPGPATNARWWAAGAAAAFSLALALGLRPVSAPDDLLAPPLPAVAEAEDLELLQRGDGIELYEDQAFYAWLADVDENSG